MPPAAKIEAKGGLSPFGGYRGRGLVFMAFILHNCFFVLWFSYLLLGQVLLFRVQG